jgi:hypothetical protein
MDFWVSHIASSIGGSPSALFTLIARLRIVQLAVNLDDGLAVTQAAWTILSRLPRGTWKTFLSRAGGSRQPGPGLRL